MAVKFDRARRRVVFVAALIVLTGALLPVTHTQAQPAAANSADAAWLAEVLEIKDGSTVGEIGAGTGELTMLLAKTVGQSGHVLSNELDADRVKTITAAAAAAGLVNVTPVQGASTETKFPDGCCEAIFMRLVYHHFNDPPAMNGSIFKSLKPGGRLAVIDVTPSPGSENPPGHRAEENHHGVTAATVEQELKAAGFEIVSSTTEERRVKVVARRPG
jgi:predicted methyltransferase